MFSIDFNRIFEMHFSRFPHFVKHLFVGSCLFRSSLKSKINVIWFRMFLCFSYFSQNDSKNVNKNRHFQPRCREVKIFLSLRGSQSPSIFRISTDFTSHSFFSFSPIESQFHKCYLTKLYKMAIEFGNLNERNEACQLIKVTINSISLA